MLVPSKKHGRIAADTEVANWKKAYTDDPIQDGATGPEPILHFRVDWDVLMTLRNALPTVPAGTNLDLQVCLCRVPDNPGDSRYPKGHLSAGFEFVTWTEAESSCPIRPEAGPAGSAVVDPCVRPPDC